MKCTATKHRKMPRHLVAFCLALTFGLLSGCGGSSSTSSNETAESSSSEESASGDAVAAAPVAYEFSGEDLLAARLPAEEASKGWVRLFDGHTLFGWEIAGDANWRVEDGTIVVDGGERCLLCTSLPWKNYELTLEFKAGPKTNSGVFLRTPLKAEDPAVDCYEVNIAPDDNPFPTAGIVKRQQSKQPDGGQPFDQWRKMEIRLDGRQLQVTVDGELSCEYSDPVDLAAGRIGLQHNSGPVAFRDIRLRPLGLDSLLDAELSKWTRYPDMSGKFTVTDEGWMHVQGGKTQLETKDSFDNFVLMAEYKLPKADMNSGIFFRCIPGEEMNGYECQLSNEMVDGKPLEPADCGTGGIFRRQDARFVAGEPDQWASVVLAANGPTMAAWVNGVQVSDFRDDRKADPNPRRGLRLEAGTIMIQGHDPGTDALLKQFNIAAVK